LKQVMQREIAGEDLIGKRLASVRALPRPLRRFARWLSA
jgi:hypothetical protein